MWTKIKKQITVYNSDTPVTLKQGQGHQIWHKLVKPKQDYNNAKFEKPHIDSTPNKPMIKFLSIQEKRQLPPLITCKSKNSGIVRTCFIYLTFL